MTQPYHTMNFDTTGLSGVPQTSNNGLRLTDEVKGTIKTVTPTVSLVRGFKKAIPDVNPSGKKKS